MEIEHILKMVKSGCKNTVGYSESSDRDEFMKGVSVALNLLEEEITPVINSLEASIKVYETVATSLESDLSTLSDIIIKHSKLSHKVDDGK